MYSKLSKSVVTDFLNRRHFFSEDDYPMSRRHRRVLEQQLSERKGLIVTRVEDADAGDDDDEEEPTQRAAFRFEMDESESEDESTKSLEEETTDMNIEIPASSNHSAAKKKSSKKKKSVKKTAKKEAVSDDSDEQTLLAELASQNKSVAVGTSPYLSAIQIDPLTLCIHDELRRKFGKIDLGSEESKSVRGSKARRPLRLKRSAFSHESPDWPDPPGFAAGGIRSRKEPRPAALHPWTNAELLCFEPSTDYRDFNHSFVEIQATGDIESMVYFLAEHPCHTDSLVQLATICLRTGNKDKGADLLRRCLYVFECAGLDRQKLLEGRLVVDFEEPYNQAFFHALYHHMRCTSMMGCESTALEVAKVLFSLDPTRDPCGVLLHLDAYALQSRKYEFVVAFSELDVPVVKSLAKLSEPPPSRDLLIGHLPSILFSKAYALHETPQKAEAATAVLKDALTRYPCCLAPLLRACGIDADAASAAYDWPTVTSSAHFQTSQGPLLAHLAAILGMRVGPFFKRDDLVLWLYSAAAAIATASLAGLTAATLVVAAAAAAAAFDDDSPAAKYLSIPLSEFGDRYEQLPPDMNVLDPALLAPRMQLEIAGAARQQQRFFQQQRRVGGGAAAAGAAGAGAAGGGVVEFDDEYDPELFDGPFQGDDPEGLDLTAPLMQLFLQSALPWNEVTFGNTGDRTEDEGRGGGGGRGDD